MAFIKSLTRISSQVRKEMIQIWRRPGAFFSLILGPFLIMAIFGIGYTGVRRSLQTVLVLPTEVGVSRDLEFYRPLVEPALVIREIAEERGNADEQLRRGEIDIIVEVPADVEERFRSGERAEISVAFNQIDPVMVAYINFIAERLSDELNRLILTTAIREGEAYAVRRLGTDDITDIPPEVLAAPTDVVPTNTAPVTPAVVSYFAPAVLALILQHMAVTLSALSLVRERLSGTMELFRVSPINAFEIVLGKYIGFGIVGALIAAVTTALLVGPLGVPLLGDPGLLAGIIALVVFASLGIGLFISVVADSERQAVQLSLLVLLASVFFSGLVLPVQEFRLGVQLAAYALPVTHGIRLFQDVMLRGGTIAGWQIAVLAGTGLVLLVLTTAILRRSLTRA